MFKRLQKKTRKVHRYVSLIVSVQLLLWTISGLYFSFTKIENVRGEQYLVEQPSVETKIQTDFISSDEAFNAVRNQTTLLPNEIELIENQKAGSEYRGRDLPLYKVVTEDERGKEINAYLDPYSGELLALRSTQWRIWDWMWGVHIMDWVERDHIDNIFLKVFSILALVTSLSGVILFIRK